MPPPAQSRALVIQVVANRSKKNPHQEIIQITDIPSRILGVVGRLSDLELRADADPFASLMNEPPAADIVFKCGKAIFDALKEIEVFDQIVLNPNDHTPVYFKLESLGSENLPWEAMWHHTQQRFVALEANWPIARLAPGNPGPWTATIEPELKMLLVLAAAPGNGSRRVDAVNEWNGIWNAVRGYAQNGRVRIHVLYCQDEVRDLIEPLAGPGVHVTSERLTEKKTLESAIVDMGPNIVHFFCHGSAEHAEARLNLATLADYDADAAEGEIWLGLNDLATTLTSTQSVWLVTLNCCQGARATSSGRSIAASLSNEGVPAVVAMRESVDFVKAGVFAGELYRHLLATLLPLLPTEAGRSRSRSASGSTPCIRRARCCRRVDAIRIQPGLYPWCTYSAAACNFERSRARVVWCSCVRPKSRRASRSFASRARRSPGSKRPTAMQERPRRSLPSSGPRAQLRCVRLTWSNAMPSSRCVMAGACCRGGSR
jgi:CHAT domain